MTRRQISPKVELISVVDKTSAVSAVDTGRFVTHRNTCVFRRTVFSQCSPGSSKNVQLEYSRWLRLPSQKKRPRFRINNSTLVSLPDVEPTCFIPSTADMKKKIELIYSPYQVSNQFKNTNQTVDWEICSERLSRSSSS